MANQKALQLIELGFHPVLLGKCGDELKRPLLKGWQTAVYTPEQVSRWPAGHNVGIRCGKQRNSLSRTARLLLPHSRQKDRFLLVFDFDEDAHRIFPLWRAQAEKIVTHMLVIVSSGRGFHAYFYVPDEMGSRTLAGRRVVENGHFGKLSAGRSRSQKFIETIGRGKQVVSAGSRHPNGGRYRFYSSVGYDAIPSITIGQLFDLTRLARRFDERPVVRQDAAPPKKPRRQSLAGVYNCLDYARRFIGTTEHVERNGDIRFLGQGGLLVTADGRGWYLFSEETGGGLPELIAWHRQQVPIEKGP